MYKDLKRMCRPLFYSLMRGWKGILGIRDLTKIRCGNRENDKYLDGIRDLTAPREAPGTRQNLGMGCGIFFAGLSGIRETVTTQINDLAVNVAGVSFQIKL